MKIAFVSVLLTLVLLTAIGLGVIYTGAYDVAATSGHGGLVEWALNTLQHSSVSMRADEVQGRVPTDSAALVHGFEHYHAMCVTCHGAPGVDRGELGQGMAPTPPELADEADEWSDAELFWITKHGIKLAGMPAFGPTHSDEEIWAIAGFVRMLPEMSPAEYQARVARVATSRTGSTGEADTHTHADGAQHQH